MANPTFNLFNFYKRYKWRAQDFTELQKALFDFPRLGLNGVAGNCVVSGLDNSTNVGLAVGYGAGVAIGASGDVLAVTDVGTVTVTASVKSLIVARPVLTNANNITNPTSPFDSVPLNTVRSTSIVALAGSAGAYPATQPGDVVLFGVTASGAAITQVDKTQCQLIGKAGEIGKAAQNTIIVGNSRHANYLDLASAVAAITTGKRIRVTENATLATSVVVSVPNVSIDFDPGVTLTNGAAATGLRIAASGVRIKAGRFSGFTTAIAIQPTFQYNHVTECRFASCATEVDQQDSLPNNVVLMNITE